MDSFFKDTYVIKFLRKLKVVLLSREWLWTVFKNCISIFWERRNLVFRLSCTSFYFNFRVFSIPLKLKPKHGRMISIYFSCCSLQKLWFFVETFKCFMIFFIFYFLIFFSLVEIFWLEVKFQHLFITVLYLKSKAFLTLMEKLVGQSL